MLVKGTDKKDDHRISTPGSIQAVRGNSDLPLRAWGAASTGLMRAHAMRAADSVQRLLETRSGSTDGVGVGPRATALAGLGGKGGGGVPAAPAAAPVAAAAALFHLSWKVGERTKYDKAVVFQCAAISGLMAEQLAR